MSYSSVVLADSPHAYWRLGESSGATAADSSGNSRSATYTDVTLGATGALTGDANTAVTMNGTSSTIATGVNAVTSINLNSTWTIEVWAKPSDTGVSRVVMGWRDGSSRAVRINRTSGNFWQGVVFDGTTTRSITSSVSASTGRWDHLVLTSDGATICFYMNGAQVGTAVHINPLISSGTALTVGYDNSGYFAGDLDEVAVYSTSLSPARVSAHYLRGLNTLTSYASEILADNPTGYWRLDETSGLVGADSSGNGLNLTHQNASIAGAAPVINGGGQAGQYTRAGSSGTRNSVRSNFNWTGVSRSFECWITPDENFSSSGPVSGAGHLGIATHVNTSYGLTTFWFNAALGNLSVSWRIGGVERSLSASFSFTSGTRYHVATTCSGGVIRIYINGALAATSATFSGGLSTSTPSFNVGGYPFATVEAQMNGRIDEVAVYGTQLSGAQIAAHYDAGTATAPANTAAPSVSGTATVGETLTTTDGTWTGTPTPTYAYQWETSADGSTGWAAISGATASTYTLVAGDYGTYLRAVVTATNIAAAVSAPSAATSQIAGVAPTSSVDPVISGTPTVGQTLTTTTGTWTGTPTPTYTYQWQTSNNGSTGWSTPLTGADGTSYTIPAGAYGKYLRVVVTATNPEGTASATSAVTSQIAGIAPANTAAPSVSGTPTVGQTLTAASGTWTGTPTPTYAYQWQASADGSTGWADITGATASSYLLVPADYDTYLRVQVTATNAEGTVAQASPATAQVAGLAPVNTVPPTEGAVSLWAPGTPLDITSQGTWTGVPTPSLGYVWERSADGITWSPIAGATGATYVLAGDDVGFYVRGGVTATSPAGAATAYVFGAALVVAIMAGGRTILRRRRLGRR